MKSLDLIEARTPISSVPFTISNTGSYYLTANLNVATGDAITIATNGVTLDLNGFTLTSAAPLATGSAIVLARVNGNADITILNGHVRGGVTNNLGIYYGGGFASGVVYSGSLPSNVRVASVSVSGCYYVGIYLNDGSAGSPYSTVVESCTVQTIAGQGIYAAHVSHSTAYQCGSSAIVAKTASDCYGYGTGSDPGVHAVTANNCYGYCTGSGEGLEAITANNCYGYTTGSGAGLNAETANNCRGQSTVGYGLAGTTATGCYGSSGVSGGSGSSGLIAYAANNCFGIATGGGSGLEANLAAGCVGFSGSGSGLYAPTATGCRGDSNSGYGLSATTAINCTGTSTSGTGLIALSSAIGCEGDSIASVGLPTIIANS